MAAPAVVLFDLDGTVSDSAPGILDALRHAFAEFGLPPLDARAERVVLGPPFYESLPSLIGNAPLDGVIAAYRAHYTAGSMYKASVYAGVPELLDRLCARGVRLAIATSKPEYYAVPIAQRLGVAGYFEAICGDEPDGSRGTKALVVAEALRRLGDPDPVSVRMVGDRAHDVVGAREHGIDCFGAGWGYAQPGELEAAGALAVCATTSELGRELEGR